MRMLTYEELKTKPRKFLTFTSLTVKEFAKLLAVFKKAYEKVYPASQTKTGETRKRKAGGGRKSLLDSITAQGYGWKTLKSGLSSRPNSILNTDIQAFQRFSVQN